MPFHWAEDLPRKGCIVCQDRWTGASAFFKDYNIFLCKIFRFLTHLGFGLGFMLVFLPELCFCVLQQYLFLNRKAKSLYSQRKRAAKLAWTVTYRKQHRKVGASNSGVLLGVRGCTSSQARMGRGAGEEACNCIEGVASCGDLVSTPVLRHLMVSTIY